MLCTWNPKQPFINGCFNWMIANLYIGNGCFTKHPIFTGCLGFQVAITVPQQALVSHGCKFIMALTLQRCKRQLRLVCNFIIPTQQLVIKIMLVDLMKRARCNQYAKCVFSIFRRQHGNKTAFFFCDKAVVSTIRHCGSWPSATPTVCIDVCSFRGEKLGVSTVFFSTFLEGMQKVR